MNQQVNSGQVSSGQVSMEASSNHILKEKDDDMANLLSEVTCVEDKSLILDVLHAIRICRHPESLCTSWTVTPTSTGYTLIAYLPKPTGKVAMSAPVEITHDDINLIECVNNLRVRVGVAMFPSSSSVSSSISNKKTENKMMTASSNLNNTHSTSKEGNDNSNNNSSNPGCSNNWGLKICITSHLIPVTFSQYDTVRFSSKRMMVISTFEKERNSNKKAKLS